MESFGKKAGGGFASVLRTDATAVEKLDALSWVNINALDQFPDEWKIQLAWMRQSPPDTPNPGLAFTMRLRQLRALLSEGIESGDIRIEDSPSLSMLARYVMDVLWVPENIVRAQGKDAALLNARDTLVRGAADVTRISAESDNRTFEYSPVGASIHAYLPGAPPWPGRACRLAPHPR